MKKLIKISFLFLISLMVLEPIIAQEYKQITIEDIYSSGTFRAKTIRGIRSMKDGEHYTSIDDGKINVYNYETGEEKEMIFNLEDQTGYDHQRIIDYSFSEDETKLLILVDRESIYRRSYLGEYFIYDLNDKSYNPLSENGKQQVASFSPDGKRIAFVRENNLYYSDLSTGEEIQVTSDGKFNHIINGHTDWVYEEEFAFTRAFDWSADSKKIAYYRFDESHVKQFNMTMFENELYPDNYTFKYPKAGEENSNVEIFVYEISTGKKVTVNIGDEKDQYITRIKWTKDPAILCLIRMNRLQNRIEILMADAATGRSQVVYEETNEYYISEINNDYPTFLNDGKHMIINSEKDGFNHLYLLDINGQEINQITEGPWEVTGYYGVDEKNGVVYYQSNERSVLRTDVYSIRLNGKKKSRLTDNAGRNGASFSRSYRYFINNHTSTTTPTVVSLYDTRGKVIRVLEDNAELKAKVREYGDLKKEFFTFKTSEDVELNGWMIKPPDYKEGKEYPVFFTIYGGPGSQTVTDSWSFGWNEMLAQKGYIVVSVDNRGTGGRGEGFKKLTYGELGKYETIDQIEAARYVGTLPYVDATRIGIYGWSYGGFMSSSCIFKGAGVFRMAIAVAPVTSWRYYDTIYTERFMGLPQDNASGYDDNSPKNFADLLEGKFLLVHGTADDNVHFQNSVELVNALIEANKQFEMMYYPDSNHGIYNGNSRVHLFTRMTNYILENL